MKMNNGLCIECVELTASYRPKSKTIAPLTCKYRNKNYLFYVCLYRNVQEKKDSNSSCRYDLLLPLVSLGVAMDRW